MYKTKAVRPKETDIVFTILVNLLQDYRDRMSTYTVKEFELDCATLKRRLHSEGLSFATRTLPSLSKGLLSYLENGKSNYIGFSVCKYGYPKLFKAIFRLIYVDKHVDSIALIYQIGEAFKKLKGPFRVKELLTQIHEFVATDQSLPDIDNFDPLLRLGRLYVNKIFGSDDEEVFNYFKPKPGPGATNIPFHVTDRYKPYTWFETVHDVFDPCSWHCASYYVSSWDRAHFVNLLKNKVSYPTSRFKFVPKKVGTARGICIEHNEVQWLQQGVCYYLVNKIERHPFTRGFVNFKRQDINSNLALSSSRTRKYATLDMKDGSNRISRTLVDSLFRDLPNLRSALMALSTPEIDFHKSFDPGRDRQMQNVLKSIPPLRTKMFAPMGSALCFPIMSLVHFVLIKAALFLYKNDPWAPVFIYGDDIIVNSENADVIFDVLPKYGMKFNTDKSYFRGHFRESCGTHAYKGINITPRYIKYLPVSDLDPKALQSVIQNECEFFEKGFTRTAECIRKQTKQALPYISPKTNLVGWKRSDPMLRTPFYRFAKKVRYVTDLQKFEYRVKTFKVEKEGSNCGMKSNLCTVLTKRQIKNLKTAKFWDEHSAYLRALLQRPEGHEHDWDNTGIIKYHYGWV